jgi:LPS biosynthesis protein
MDRKVTWEESRKIRLDVLVEVDDFCRKNNLRYFLAFGTLLGAIRHKGYIPWDDDTDIMMPRKDLEIFKRTFKYGKIQVLRC